MPIGKNSLKRVTNNGYSAVNTSAPDMENSEISLVSEAKAHTEEILAPRTDEGKAAIARAKEKVSAAKEAKKRTEAKKKPAEKITPAEKAKETVKSMSARGKKTVKTATKSDAASAKKSTAKTAVKAEAAPKVEKVAERAGEGYVNLGGSLPYYLL